MARVSAERLFRSHFPNATIERQKPTYDPAYYLVRKSARAFMWSGSGDTKAKAWDDACDRHGIVALKEQP